MKENKNIERLFQEKFKDFEATPPLQSWNAIEARLNKKEKKKRIIPFWFKSMGMAAVFTLGFFLFINKENDSTLLINESENEINNPISNIETSSDVDNDTSKIQNNKNNSIKENDILNKKSFINNNTNIVLDNTQSSQSKTSTQNKSNRNDLNTGVVSNKNTNKPSISTKEKINNKTNKINENESLVTNNKTQKNSNSVNNNDLLTNQNVNSTNKNLVTNNKTNQNSNSVNNNELLTNQNFNSTNKNQSLVINNKTQSKLNSKNNNELLVNQNINSSIENELVSNTIKEGNPLIDKSKLELLNSNNTLNNEAVLFENSSSLEITDTLLTNNENIIANAIQDSILLASVETEENPLEKLLKEKMEGKDADEKEKEKRNKWAFSTVASPVYFNSTTSNGSSLDPTLESNSKDYENSLSYGLGLEYEVSKKWSVKAGVNTLTFGYNTNDVMFYQDVNARSMKHIKPSESGAMLSIQSRKTASLNSVNISGNVTQRFDGEINQKMGYIEVPLELSYKLLDKKFGINIVGGMSTLFLNENKVSLVSSNGSEINIGEANNLNDIHFSSNVGLGFKYTFWNSFQANFQPMFKYQINTFSNDAGNFKPYFIGLYSGVSFSF